MTENITIPYRNLKEYDKVSIEAYQLTSDIKNHIKMNLKKKLEKKCNKNGFIDTIYKVVEYSDGIMKPENFIGTVIYEVGFHCRICNPIENSIILSQVKVMNQELVITIDGPIYTFIPRVNIDTSIWKVTGDEFINNNNNKLSVGNYVKVLILNKRINKNDIQIKTIGKLLDIATDKEIENYFEKEIKEEEEKENNFDF